MRRSCARARRPRGALPGGRAESLPLRTARGAAGPGPRPAAAPRVALAVAYAGAGGALGAVASPPANVWRGDARVVSEPRAAQCYVMGLDTAISGPRLLRAWTRRSWSEYGCRTVQYWLAPGACQVQNEDADYGHL